MRILLVEDDRDVAGYIARTLEEEGDAVTVLHDGSEALSIAAAHSFDMIVLDVMLPSLDGIELTTRLRARNIETPILLLTGRDSPEDVVRGLDSGADDYLTKPFSMDVLLARLRARTRPQSASRKTRLRYADLIVDIEDHSVWRGQSGIALTRMEFRLLECLIRAAGRTVVRQLLVEAAWGTDRSVTENNLDVFIRLLRVKIDPPGSRRLIQTVRGVGYVLREET